MSDTISFKPKAVVRGFLTVLQDRAQDILKKRFGLDSERRLTLDAIGKKYGITRERVRQIEDFALRTIRRSDEFARAEAVFLELKQALHYYGGVAHEQEFLKHLDKDQVNQNNFHFLLVLGNEFVKFKENEDFHHRWATDEDLAGQVEKALRQVAENLDEEDLMPEEDMVARVSSVYPGDNMSGSDQSDQIRRWLLISKQLGTNPVGEWGLARSPNVRARGVRDYAFLVLRQQGSPMHFTEVAKEISDQFGRRANPATCHNELIKDGRFVLVGRGMYALTDWGYRPGVVLDVIQNILREHGPLEEGEVITKVLKERYVKPNTVLVNLKNPKYFKRDTRGRYLVS